MPKDPNDPETQKRAAARHLNTELREAQASEREREAAARVVAIDEKTPRLKALRLAKEAEEAASAAEAAASKATKPKKR